MSLLLLLTLILSFRQHRFPLLNARSRIRSSVRTFSEAGEGGDVDEGTDATPQRMRVSSKRSVLDDDDVAGVVDVDDGETDEGEAAVERR